MQRGCGIPLKVPQPTIDLYSVRKTLKNTVSV